MSPPDSDQTYGRDPALTALGGPLDRRSERILHHTSRVNGEPNYSMPRCSTAPLAKPPEPHRVDRLAPTWVRPSAAATQRSPDAERRQIVRFLSEDDYLAAVQDAAYDRFLQTAVQCRDCGMCYEQGHHPATRREPAWSECGECPNCGSTAITEP